MIIGLNIGLITKAFMPKLFERRIILLSITGIAIVVAILFAVIGPSEKGTALQGSTLSPELVEDQPLASAYSDSADIPVNPFGPTGSQLNEDSTSPASNTQQLVNSNPKLSETVNIEELLYSSIPEERVKALDLVLESPELFFNQAQIVNRIDELTSDRDPEIAEFANNVLIHFAELQAEASDAENQPSSEIFSSLEEPLEEPIPDFTPEEIIETDINADTTNIEDDLFTQLSDRALRDPDSLQRHQAIEEALIQRDNQTVGLLSEALQDVDADNRLLAAEGLRQLWSEGIGDSEEIIIVLQQSTTDSDSRVAKAAQQALEQLADKSAQ